MSRQLLWRIHLAEVPEVVLADKTLDGVPHEVDVELEPLKVDLGEAAFPFGLLGVVGVRGTEVELGE